MMEEKKDSALEKPSRKILVAEDESSFRFALTFSLEKEGYRVTAVESGNQAFALMEKQSFDVVISDINMPDGSGIDLLKKSRSKYTTPIVLMTGFKEITETQEAFLLGANGFLAKPFKKIELIESIESLFRSLDQSIFPKLENKPAPAPDDDYRKVSIADFISGKEIRSDIYIRLAQGKYVKIAHKGERIPIDQVRRYQEKGIDSLYLTKEDFDQYIQFMVNLSASVKSSDALSNEKKINFLKHTSQLILEEVFVKGIDEVYFNDAKAITEMTVSLLSDQDDAAKLLESLNSHSDFLYCHSLGVSMYSVMLAKELKWANNLNVNKLAQGGIFHDIGKKEIPVGLLTKTRKDLTTEEVAIIETHPIRGMEILSTLRSISSDVLLITQQHHENCMGYGYPSRLKKNKIHPMARVVAVADEFCNHMLKGPKQLNITAPMAIQRISTFSSGILDNAVILALIRIFKLQDTPDFRDICIALKLGAK